MAEQEVLTSTTPPPAEPVEPTPTEEPKPEGETAGATPTTEEPKPEGETAGEEEPQSAFDKLTEGLTDPDEIEAIRERLLEKLPEDRRKPKVEATAEEAQSAILAEQRRQESKRQHEGQRDSAVGRLNAHLKEVKTKFSAGDEGEYDADLLTGAINEIVQAEIALADQGARELFSTALSTRLQKHGGPVSDERFKELVKAVAENKVEHGIVGAYLDEYGERRYQHGLSEGRDKAQSKDAAWRKAEKAAQRAELMSEREIEPDAGRGGRSLSEQGRLDRLAFGQDENGNAVTDDDRAWLATRN